MHNSHYLPDKETVRATLSSLVWGRINLHLKTNISVNDHTMYHLTVDGYSYDQSKPIHSEVVGYTYSQRIIADKIVDGYGHGAGQGKPYDGNITKQYVSEDGFVVLKMIVGHYATKIGVSAMTGIWGS